MQATLHHQSITAATLTQESSTKPDVRVIRSFEGIACVREYWGRWVRHPNAEPDCYSAVTQGPSAKMEPFIVVLYRDGVPDALLIGRVEDARVDVRLGYRSLASIKARQLVFVYGGFVGNCSLGNARELVMAVRESLDRGVATLALFNGLQTGSDLFRAVAEEGSLLTRDRAPTVECHRSMSLPSGAIELQRQMSAKVRKNLAWQARKLLKDFPGMVRLRRFHKLNEVHELIRDAEEVAATTYQRQLGVGFTNSTVIQCRLVAEAANDWLRGYVLYIDNKPVAFWIGKLYQGTFYSDFMGYDAALAKYSPGTFVLMTVIERLCDGVDGDGATNVDFGFGDAQYKRVFGDSEWREATVYMFGTSPKAMYVNAIRTPFLLMERTAKKVLSSLDLLQSTKTRWRRALRRSPAG